jgi:phage baseplate assembly protein W
MAERDFLGVGWQFPVAVAAGAERITRIAVSAYERSVEEAIRIILGTSPGERMMRPAFGCGLNRLAFAPNNMSTAGLAMLHVREALERWEPRIELLAVDAEPQSEPADTMLIRIDYRVVATHTVHNLVYPFYLGKD